jgi:hypothetical protein
LVIEALLVSEQRLRMDLGEVKSVNGGENMILSYYDEITEANPFS